MNDCQTLHETIVRDMVDAIELVKDDNVAKEHWKKPMSGSIARRAKNLILVFPVIVSGSLSISAASLISKAIERKCVSLLQILFSSIQYSSGVQNANDYVKLFHTNLNGSMSLDDFVRDIDRLTGESAITITDHDAYNAVMEDMKNLNYYLDTNYNPHSISEYSVKEYNGEYIVLREANEENPNKAVQVGDPQSFIKNRLIAGDIQKANELTPTLMTVNFNIAGKNDKGEDTIIGNQTAVVGVKAKLYPVDAMDVINRISSKVKDKNGLFSLVRASTREISFFKDLAFAVDKAKTDAINIGTNSSNAKIFRLLERRARKNKFSTLMKKNDASPITSLVISQDDVEYMKKYCNTDATKPYVTRKLLEGFNLLDIVIVDESLEIARFLYDDGDGVFETLPFDALEKESKDNGYKKVLNILGKSY